MSLTGLQLKTEGIDRAIKSADQSNAKWSETAYKIAKEYLKKVRYFMTEDLRSYAEEKKEYTHPPSKRAWGGIIRKLKQDGFILHHSYGKVKNPLAHQANASVWKVCK